MVTYYFRNVISSHLTPGILYYCLVWFHFMGPDLDWNANGILNHSLCCFFPSGPMLN
ncbi:hypothetical protein DAI22_11g012500 [Oryza sativa Japonica Group]|nr:hypothetical protein DAI22_11g012500 [Oryza sativa Japonica Group]